MVTNNIELFIKSYSREVYSLAYHLTLNEEKSFLMTQEAMRLFIQQNPETLSLQVKAQRDDERESKNKIQILKLTHKICLKSQASTNQDFGRWQELSSLERATLYLKHKLKLSYADLEEILEISSAELIAHAHQARTFLLEGRSDLC